MLMYREEIVREVQQHWQMKILPRQLLPQVAGLLSDNFTFDDTPKMRKYISTCGREASLAVVAYAQKSSRSNKWVVDERSVSYSMVREMVSRKWKDNHKGVGFNRLIKGTRFHRCRFVKRWIPAYSGRDPDNRIVVAALTICIWTLRKVMYMMRERSRYLEAHRREVESYADNFNNNARKRRDHMRTSLMLAMD